MSMKFNSLLSLGHQILTRSMRNFLNILYVHSQTMCKRIILNTTSNSYPVSFFNHTELNKFFAILHPTLHSKTRGIISYLKIYYNPTCFRFTLLYIKNISFKNNPIFFRIDFNHWSNLSLIKACNSLTLFLSKILGLMLLRWWYRRTLNN